MCYKGVNNALEGLYFFDFKRLRGRWRMESPPYRRPQATVLIRIYAVFLNNINYDSMPWFVKVCSNPPQTAILCGSDCGNADGTFGTQGRDGGARQA